jgi:hypothetical protein
VVELPETAAAPPECGWCTEPLVAGEVVHDPHFDPNGPLGDDGPQILHLECAVLKRCRKAEYEHHTTRGTPIGLALLRLEDLVGRLNEGHAVMLMPTGDEAEDLRQLLRRAKGIVR